MFKSIRIGTEAVIINTELSSGVCIADIQHHLYEDCDDTLLRRAQIRFNTGDIQPLGKFTSLKQVPVIRINGASVIYYEDLLPLIKGLYGINTNQYKLVQVEDVIDYLLEFLNNDKASLNLNNKEEIREFYNWLSPKLEIRSAKVTKALLMYDASSPLDDLILPYDYHGWYISSVMYDGRLHRRLFE